MQLVILVLHHAHANFIHAEHLTLPAVISRTSAPAPSQLFLVLDVLLEAFAPSLLDIPASIFLACCSRAQKLLLHAIYFLLGFGERVATGLLHIELYNLRFHCLVWLTVHHPQALNRISIVFCYSILHVRDPGGIDGSIRVHALILQEFLNFLDCAVQDGVILELCPISRVLVAHNDSPLLHPFL